MFNKALFKLEWKSNYKILVIFCLILTMYTTIMLAMYDPKLGTALETFAKSKSSPDSCVKCYTMFLPFLLIKIDVFS